MPTDGAGWTDGSEDLSWVPSIHIRWPQSPITPAPVYSSPLISWGTCAHIHIHTHIDIDTEERCLLTKFCLLTEYKGFSFQLQLQLKKQLLPRPLCLSSESYWEALAHLFFMHWGFCLKEQILPLLPWRTCGNAWRHFRLALWWGMQLVFSVWWSGQLLITLQCPRQPPLQQNNYLAPNINSTEWRIPALAYLSELFWETSTHLSRPSSRVAYLFGKASNTSF